MSRPEQDPPSLPADARLRALLAGEAAAALRAAAGDVEAHLVGGAVRDALLGRPARDLDAVVERDGEAIATRLAERLGGRPIRLGGDEFAAWRVARRDLVVDVWDREGGPLAVDLARRDVTVNALAASLATGQIADPCGGLDDLERRLLRAPRATTFVEDALRVLRLARLAATLPGFRIEMATAGEARAVAPRLLAVAPERLRVELELALGAEDGADLLSALTELDLHPGLWLGQPGIAEPSESARRRFAALGDAERWLEVELPHLAPRIQRPRLNGALLALDLSRLSPAGGLRELRHRGWLTRREGSAMARLLPWAAPPVAVPEQRWLLHRTGAAAWPTGLLVAGTAPSAAGDWRETARALARLAERHGAEIFDPPPLLDGHELSRLTGLPPGPGLGEQVARLRRLQIEGALTDAEAARRWVRLSSPDAD